MTIEYHKSYINAQFKKFRISRCEREGESRVVVRQLEIIKLGRDGNGKSGVEKYSFPFINSALLLCCNNHDCYYYYFK